jgi:hypothetical protein
MLVQAHDDGHAILNCGPRGRSGISRRLFAFMGKAETSGQGKADLFARDGAS